MFCLILKASFINLMITISHLGRFTAAVSEARKKNPNKQNKTNKKPTSSQPSDQHYIALIQMSNVWTIYKKGNC